MTKHSRLKADTSHSLRIIAGGLAIANIVYAAHYTQILLHYGFDPIPAVEGTLAFATAIGAGLVSRRALRQRA